MKTISMLRTVLFFSLCLGMPPVSADSMSDLKESFKKRYPELQARKASGEVGETGAGTVEAVTAAAASDAAVKAVVDAENADRGVLYAAIARKEGISAADVAARNAARNFKKAAPGHWLKGEDGWKQR